MLRLTVRGACASCALFPKIVFELQVSVMLLYVLVEGVSTVPRLRANRVLGHCSGRAQSKASTTPRCQSPATALDHEFVGGGGIVQEEPDQRQGMTMTPRW